MPDFEQMISGQVQESGITRGGANRPFEKSAVQEKHGLDEPAMAFFPVRASDLIPTTDTPLGEVVPATELKHKANPDTIRALAEHFDFRGYLGEGATSVVFQATDKKTGQRVVIKPLRPDASDTTRGYFEEEGLNLAALQFGQQKLGDGLIGTPVKIDDHVGGRRDVIVQTEAYEGERLDEYMSDKNGTLTLQETLDTLDQALRILEALNSQGKTYSDMQFKNFVVKKAQFGPYSTKLTVIDWNHVGQLDPNLVETPQGHPNDMFSAIDDVRRLASYSTRMLARKSPPPFPETQSQIDHELPSGVPNGLSLFIKRALSPDVTYRYPNAASFRTAIQEYRSLLQRSPQEIISEMESLRASLNVPFDDVVPEKYFDLALREATLRDILPFTDPEGQKQVTFEINNARRWVRIPDFDYYKGKMLLAKAKDVDSAVEHFESAQGRTGGTTIARWLEVAKAAKQHPDLLDKINSHYLIENITFEPAWSREALVKAGLTPEYLKQVGLDFIETELAARELLASGTNMDLAGLQTLKVRLLNIPYGSELVADLALDEKIQPLSEQEAEHNEVFTAKQIYKSLLENATVDNIPALVWHTQTSKYATELEAIYEEWARTHNSLDIQNAANVMMEASIKSQFDKDTADRMIRGRVLYGDGLDSSTLEASDLNQLLQSSKTLRLIYDSAIHGGISQSQAQDYIRTIVLSEKRSAVKNNAKLRTAKMYISIDGFESAKEFIDSAAQEGVDSSTSNDLLALISYGEQLRQKGENSSQVAEITNLIEVIQNGNPIDSSVQFDLLIASHPELTELFNAGGVLNPIKNHVNVDLAQMLQS